MENQSTQNIDDDGLWAIVTVKNQHFALPVVNLQEVVVLPPVSTVPSLPDHILGVFNLRGQVVPVIDLRKRLGWGSVKEEVVSFCELMDQREQDHKNWLNELESSVRERREFKLTTDPHRCKFGVWYDAYKSDDPWIAAQLRKFDVPHQKIHKVGEEVTRLVAKGQHQQAHTLIETARENTLAVLLRLFDELRTLFRESHMQTVAIIRSAEKLFGATIDAAVSVEKLAPGSIEVLPLEEMANHNNVIHRFGRRMKDDEVVLIIEPGLLSQG